MINIYSQHLLSIFQDAQLETSICILNTISSVFVNNIVNRLRALLVHSLKPNLNPLYLHLKLLYRLPYIYLRQSLEFRFSSRCFALSICPCGKLYASLYEVYQFPHFSVVALTISVHSLSLSVIHLINLTNTIARY